MTETQCALLRKMAVFGGLTDASLELILGHSKKIELKTGEYFFREGDASDSLYVVEAGEVAIEKRWNDSAIELCRFRRGDCFGEMALIDLMPRSASARAEADCQVMEIPRRCLFELYKQNVEQYAIIMMNMGREVSRRLRVADDRLFKLEQMIPEPMP
jgi:CRP-like cAMP-binding protein